MKKILMTVALTTMSGVVTAGELVITENTDSSVSIKASKNRLSINDAVVPVPLVVGRDPQDQQQYITIGPALTADDNFEEIVTLVEYNNKSYSLQFESDGFVSFVPRLLFSDSNCEMLAGAYNISTDAIFEFPVVYGNDGMPVENPNTGLLFAVTTDTWSELGDSTLYSKMGQPRAPCQEFILSQQYNQGSPLEKAYIFPVEKVTISKEELFNGAIAPYRIIYR